MNVNDIPVPTEDQIHEIAERIGTSGLDFTDAQILRLCGLILYQDKVIEQIESERPIPRVSD